MPVTTYTVIDGEIVEENRGGVIRDYAPDRPGNTVALMNTTQSVTDTSTYLPYGQGNARMGTTATPFVPARLGGRVPRVSAASRRLSNLESRR